MKKLLLFWSCIVMTSSFYAQELETILLASDDASKLSQNYLNPAIKGLMYSMNGGWYSTAKTHKKLGFDITISANVSFVPDADQLFTFSDSDYAFLSLPNGDTTLPTIMSENNNEALVDVSIPVGDGTFKVASFDMPGGITDELPVNAVPAPMLQAGLGLPFKTDVKLRYVPKLNFDDDVEADLIGFGVQHDLMQYLGPLDRLPLNISVLAAFTKMNVTYNINDENATDNVLVTNGKAEFKMNAITFQALASLDFPILTLYGGLGYNLGDATAKMKGNYEVTYDIEDSSGNVISTISESVTDPINLDFKANGVRATLGARLNLAFFKIFADYTVQEYNTVSAGFAFSFR